MRRPVADLVMAFQRGEADALAFIESVFLEPPHRRQAAEQRAIERLAADRDPISAAEAIIEEFFNRPPWAPSNPPADTPQEAMRRQAKFMLPARDESAPVTSDDGLLVPGQSTSTGEVGPLPPPPEGRRRLDEVEVAGRVIAGATLRNLILRDVAMELALDTRLRAMRIGGVVGARLRTLADNLSGAARAAGTAMPMRFDPETQSTEQKLVDQAMARGASADRVQLIRELLAEHNELLRHGCSISVGPAAYVKLNLDKERNEHEASET